MRKVILPSYPIALLVALCLSVLALGQTDRGTLTGRVADNTSAIVPGATVQATNVATNSSSTAVTTSDGIYVIPALPPGIYKIKVEKAGFKTAEVTGVTLIGGGTVDTDIAMAVGQ